MCFCCLQVAKQPTNAALNTPYFANIIYQLSVESFKDNVIVVLCCLTKFRWTNEKKIPSTCRLITFDKKFIGLSDVIYKSEIQFIALYTNLSEWITFYFCVFHITMPSLHGLRRHHELMLRVKRIHFQTTKKVQKWKNNIFHNQIFRPYKRIQKSNYIKQLLCSNGKIWKCDLLSTSP